MPPYAIAYHPETDERHVVQMADLGDGAGLHIDGQCIRKILLDLLDVLIFGAESVTAGDETGTCTGSLRDV